MIELILASMVNFQLIIEGDYAYVKNHTDRTIVCYIDGEEYYEFYVRAYGRSRSYFVGRVEDWDCDFA